MQPRCSTWREQSGADLEGNFGLRDDLQVCVSLHVLDRNVRNAESGSSDSIRGKGGSMRRSVVGEVEISKLANLALSLLPEVPGRPDYNDPEVLRTTREPLAGYYALAQRFRRHVNGLRDAIDACTPGSTNIGIYGHEALRTAVLHRLLTAIAAGELVERPAYACGGADAPKPTLSSTDRLWAATMVMYLKVHQSADPISVIDAANVRGGDALVSHLAGLLEAVATGAK